MEVLYGDQDELDQNSQFYELCFSYQSFYYYSFWCYCISCFMNSSFLRKNDVQTFPLKLFEILYTLTICIEEISFAYLMLEPKFFQHKFRWSPGLHMLKTWLSLWWSKYYISYHYDFCFNLLIFTSQQRSEIQGNKFTEVGQNSECHWSW